VFYVIQIIVSGKIVPPRVFADQTCAQAAFVALVREHRAAAYAEYCFRHEADPEAFTTAKAFAGTGEEDEPVRFCYWELALDDDGSAATQAQSPPQSREPVLQAAAETQQQVLGVQTELRGLVAKLTGLSQELIQLQTLLGDEGEEAAADETSGAAELAEPAPDVLDEKYQTAEWRDFVQSLIRMCGGNWGEFPLLSRQDWRQAVYGNLTALSYWEWVAITIDQSIERAKNSGYAVEEDGEKRGHFAYRTPTGERSTNLYELEDLAWCAAGLHAVQQDGPQV